MNTDDIREKLVQVDPKLASYFDSLSENERSWVLRGLSELIKDNKSLSMDFLEQIDYDRKPVSIEQFLDDPYYLGTIDMWPRWRQELLHVFNPKNEINEVIIGGAIGCGKCMAEGTLVYTDSGLIPIDYIVKNKLYVRALTESGYRTIKEYHDEGITDTIKITTRHNHFVEGRPNHRIRILDKNGDIVWKPLSDIRTGDTLVEQPNKKFGDIRFGSRPAELLGWIVAEGNRILGNRDGTYSGWGITVSTEEGDYVYDLIEECKDVFNYRIGKRVPIGNAVRMYMGGGKLIDILKPSKSKDKEVPADILMADRESICGFLRGYFSGDGYSNTSDCSVTTVSEKLCRQVRVLLTSLGIECSVGIKPARYRKDGMVITTGTSYTIRIVGQKAQIDFMNMVGFMHKRKQDILRDRCQKYNRNCDHAFSFRLSKEAIKKIQNTQPKYADGEAPKGYNKNTSPSKKISRGQRQNISVRLLNEVLVRGNLPDNLVRLASRELLFDTVKSTENSKAHCYDLSIEGDPSYIGDGFISHNTFDAMIMVLYKLYQLSCLKDPASHCGLAKGTPIVFGIYNATLKLTDVGMGSLNALLNNCPYFKENFWYKELYSELLFPKNIKVMTGSHSFHSLGSNLMVLAIDELNFHMQTKKEAKSKVIEEKGKIHELVQQTSRRVESRFATYGLIIHISSTKTSNSYLELRKKEVRGNKHVYIIEGPQWEFQPPRGRRESGKTFRFVVGNKLIKPYCLDTVIDLGHRKFEIVSGGDTPRNIRVINVPVEDYRAFYEGPIGALRDIAGIPSESVNPFFPRGQPVAQAGRPWDEIPHPFIEGMGAKWSTPMKIDLQTKNLIQDYVIRDVFLTVRSSKEIPRRMPHSPRYIHVDIGRNGDALGISMCHPTKAIVKQVKSETGDMIRNMELEIEHDFNLQIKPDGDEVDWEKIREFIIWLREKGFLIRKVTYDSPASAGEIQYLKKSGIDAVYLSLDKKPDMYYVFKTMLNEGRVSWARNEVLEDELLALEIMEDDKIDHPSSGSKDLSDAACGSVWNCTQDPEIGTLITPMNVNEVTYQDKILNHVKSLVDEKLTKGDN